MKKVKRIKIILVAVVAILGALILMGIFNLDYYTNPELVLNRIYKRTVSATSYGAHQYSPVSLSKYTDDFMGFSIGKPGGWIVSVDSGSIVVKKDKEGLTCAVIYPLVLKENLSSKELLLKFIGILEETVSAGGGKITPGEVESSVSSSHASFKAYYGGTDLRGEVFTNIEGMRGICRIFWSPKTSFESDRDTLYSIINSFEVHPAKPLIVHRGSVFSVSIPEGWYINETQSGVDVISPEYGFAMVSSALLIGQFGRQTPSQLIDWVVSVSGSGKNNFTFIKEENYPPIPDPSGMANWNLTAKEFIAYKDGIRIRGVITAGTVNFYGQFNAVVSIRQAPEDKWEYYGPLLEVIEKSCAVTNPSMLGGRSSVMLPANHPADSSSIMSSWEYKNRVQSEASSAWQESMGGYERMRSPSTGTCYDMPLNAYDASRGGYINPEKLKNGEEELLVR